MIIQEEIRKGLWEILDDFDVTPALKIILLYLHSQGVVIEVDRELPKNPFEDGGSLRESECGAFDSVCIGQQDMLKDGYVAVESLIETT